MKQHILYLFTRTPLHVGAGSSVGAIDQPVQRERHTGFPIIPGSSIKGVFADEWNDALEIDSEGKKTRGNGDAAWLFGSDSDKNPHAGALQFSEAKLFAFPVRSAKGCFAWITCPLILKRAIRDGVLSSSMLPFVEEVSRLFCSPESGSDLDPDSHCLVSANNKSIVIGENAVLEEYTFSKHDTAVPVELMDAVASVIQDSLWKEEVPNRFVILSDGQMSYFARNACEVAQHVRINDERGTAVDGALFNQENVPSETLFYSMVTCFGGRGALNKDKESDRAADSFVAKVNEKKILQFGGDASTGLGYCSLELKEVHS